MNKLSYKIENFVGNDGYKDIEFTAYCYLVDDKKLDFGSNYLPATCWDILDDEDDETDENHKMVVLCTCICGQWACDSYVAKVVEKETTIEWYVHRLRQDAKETPDYIFDKTEYATVIAEIKNKAQKEISEKRQNK